MTNLLSVSVSLSFPLSSLSLSRDCPSNARNKSYGKEEHDGHEGEDTLVT